MATTPATYHRVMRKHLFLAEADAVVAGFVSYWRSVIPGRVLEIGSGTGALTVRLSNVGIESIDLVEPEESLRRFWTDEVNGIECRKVDGAPLPHRVLTIPSGMDGQYSVLVSQGFHHHALPDQGTETLEVHRGRVMKRCFDLLCPGGVYVVSDEFVSEYTTEEIRQLYLRKWYQCVIAHALASGLPELARMESVFLTNDFTGTEYKESVERFVARARACGFEELALLRLGFSAGCPGGFCVLSLRRPVHAADPADPTPEISAAS